MVNKPNIWVVNERVSVDVSLVCVYVCVCRYVCVITIRAYVCACVC